MRLKLLLLSFFVYSVIWSQTTKPLISPSTGSFKVPAGVTSLDVETWGAGGAGGGVIGLLSLYGGGGGGGAYNKTTFTSIAPSATLNYTVGAGGVGVSGANGGDGGNSIFSTVTVNGGLGGSKGNPTQGVGGTGGAASGTGTIFSGGKGGDAILLSGTLYSGAGGGAAGSTSNGGNGVNATAGAGGNIGGGAGAPGVLAVNNGIAGNSPGGGGSGGEALIGLLGAAIGGNGGNGQIKVTYTCPTYGLSSTTADDVCTGTGTTTTVRLTGSVSSLPNGDYVVTYNRSNPSLNGTGLTANMTVSSGIGTFTATGFTATGTSTITITNISSGIITRLTPLPVAQIDAALCSNNITLNNTVDIAISPISVGGTISGGSSMCNGSISGVLTLSGKIGSILYWEYSVAPFSSWSPLNNTTTTYSPGALTQTTHFRAIVKNGDCSQAISAIAIVTVNPLPTITTSGTLNTICFNTLAQTATLPYTATTNSPSKYSIDWNPAANSAALADQGDTTFSFLGGVGNLNTIVIPAGVAANTYSGIMTISNANCSVTQAIQLAISPKPSAPIPGAVTEPTCVLPIGSVTLGGLPASVTWLVKQTGTASTTYTSTGTSYLISNLVPGSYQFTVEYPGSCVSAVSANVDVHNLVTNTYNSSWSNGTPTINQNLVFASNYASAGAGLGNIVGCSCLVNPGINVLINSDDTLTIQNAVINNGGTLTFENNASLVQNNAAAVNSGNIIYKRNSTAMKNFDFTYWSSPVAGQTLFGLSPNTLWDKYLSYTTTGWHVEQYGATVMAQGVGYIIRTPKAGTWPNGEVVTFPYSQAVQFIGTPNNGNITGQSVIAGKFYLIGNPYPSAISADAFLFGNPNNSAILDGTIYFWTHNTPLQSIGSQQAYSSGD